MQPADRFDVPDPRHKLYAAVILKTALHLSHEPGGYSPTGDGGPFFLAVRVPDVAAAIDFDALLHYLRGVAAATSPQVSESAEHVGRGEVACHPGDAVTIYWPGVPVRLKGH